MVVVIVSEVAEEVDQLMFYHPLDLGWGAAVYLPHFDDDVEWRDVEAAVGGKMVVVCGMVIVDHLARVPADAPGFGVACAWPDAGADLIGPFQPLERGSKRLVVSEHEDGRRASGNEQCESN